MRYIITGGEGFVIRNLKELLLKENHEVKTLDIDGNPDYKADISDYESVLKASKNIDDIFHLVTVTSLPQFETDMPGGFGVNVTGTLNVLRAAFANGSAKVVQASSSSVYGDLEVAGKEDMPIFGHKNMYSTTKLFDEYLEGISVCVRS